MSMIDRFVDAIHATCSRCGEARCECACEPRAERTRDRPLCDFCAGRGAMRVMVFGSRRWLCGACKARWLVLLIQSGAAPKDDAASDHRAERPTEPPYDEDNPSTVDPQGGADPPDSAVQD